MPLANQSSMSKLSMMMWATLCCNCVPRMMPPNWPHLGLDHHGAFDQLAVGAAAGRIKVDLVCRAVIKPFSILIQRQQAVVKPHSPARAATLAAHAGIQGQGAAAAGRDDAIEVTYRNARTWTPALSSPLRASP